MANEEQVERLIKSVDAWNQWRAMNRQVVPDLVNMKLWGGDLSRANLSDANLAGAYLRETKLINADLSRANLSEADLYKARLSGATFNSANLHRTRLARASIMVASLILANLKQADLHGAQLVFSNMSRADLTGANLTEANLLSANFSGAELAESNMTRAAIGETVFTNVDLSRIKGLEAVNHMRPSSIGIDTIYRSQGRIPIGFLRTAGVPEPFIAEVQGLVAAMEPIQLYSCFISYSTRDQEFATRLYADLQDKGVRCWFAPEDLKIGDKLRMSFDEAIRVHDKLMVVLSESSVESGWVEKEAETAFEKERQQKRTVLFPIRIDDAVMETKQAWAADLRRTRHIGDFRDWKHHNSYKKAFERLLRDLTAKGKLSQRRKADLL